MTRFKMTIDNKKVCDTLQSLADLDIESVIAEYNNLIMINNQLREEVNRLQWQLEQQD